LPKSLLESGGAIEYDLEMFFWYIGTFMGLLMVLILTLSKSI
jgi:hypothetical protein